MMACARAKGDDYTPLESVIGYRFRDRAHLVECLHHASASEGRDAAAARGFQRLEFLGDRVLALGIAEILLDTYPDEDEGHIARRHAFLVDRHTLASIADAIGLEDWIVLSHSARKDLATNRESILADCLESLLAGVYRDGGHAGAHTVVARLWHRAIAAQGPAPLNPKSQLQERVQADGLPPPEYRVSTVAESQKTPLFVAQVHIQGHPPAQGEGKSKREATTQAAQAMLDRLEK